MWANQKYRIEVWIEKEALEGVFQPACAELDVPFLCCRGYTSQSEMWRAGMRLRRHAIKGKQRPIVLHFGDHDPSGIDMTRDIVDRLAMFIGSPIKLERVALNMDQIEQYDPPPNPAKTTDSRANEYIALFGTESWELDALEPRVLHAMVQEKIRDWIDDERWQEKVEERDEARRKMFNLVERWDDISDQLD